MKNFNAFKKLCMIAVLLLLCFGNAEAAKNDWKDNSYDFSSIKTVWVEDIDLSGVELRNDIHEKRMQQYYHEQENRLKWTTLNKERVERKISLLTLTDLDTLHTENPEKAAKLWEQNLPKVVDAYVTAKVTRYEHSSYVIKAHTIWETKEVKETYKDKDNKTETITRTYEVPVHVPERTVWVGNVTVRYDLHDAKDGRIIFSREDVRSDEDDLMNIYELSVRSFFRDLKIKKR